MRVIHDDCLNSMRAMEQNTIDMIYLDPPFFTQKEHVLSDKEGKLYNFSDEWNSITDYIDYITERLVEAKRILKDSGSIFLHCDTTASHYLKVAMDKIFNKDNFRSEIIWYYKRWSNAKNGLLNAHQTILYYTKTSNYKFNKIFTDYSPTTNVDQILQDRVRNEDGKAVYKTDDDGNVIYTNEKKGVPLSDVWEIPFLNPKAKERVGYPTQKPILLLERIIEISTDRGDLVLDPFCGSGTTLVAASLMGRDYVGIDTNPDAIELTNRRLDEPVKTNSYLMEKGKDAYITKSDYEKSILDYLDCNIVQRNKGIDAILKKHYNGKSVSVRIQKDGESIEDAVKLLHKASIKKDCSYSILIKTNNLCGFTTLTVPSNVLIINSYDIAIQKFLESNSEN